MRQLGAWLWRRHPDRFVAWLNATTSALVIVGLFLPAVGIGSAYLGLTLAQGAVWLVASVCVTVLAQWSVGRSLRSWGAPIDAWSSGDRQHPRETWEAIVRLPQILGQRAGILALPFHVVLVAPVVVVLAEPGATGLAGLAVAYPLVALTCVLLYSTTGQLLVQAAADDVAAHGPPIEALDHGGWSVRGRLFTVIVVVGTLCAGAAPPMVLGGAVTETDYLVALVGGGAFALYMAFVVDAGLIQPLLVPLREVAAATARVRRGDASVAVPVSTVDELGDLAAAFNEMQRGLRERASLHAAFGSYVDPVLAQRLLDSGSAVFEGEELDVTVLFADVRGFTAYAEQVDPSTAVERLNRLFDLIVPVLHEHGGHANHYLGDGLLAVFGAPQPLERHAEAAVTAALEIQQAVLVEFSGAVTLGIGINTGPVIAGTVGGGGRHEFTVIGDTVNVASRVEQLTKETGDRVLITEATRAALPADAFSSMPRGAFAVRGKSAKVTVHALAPKPRRAP